MYEELDSDLALQWEHPEIFLKEEMRGAGQGPHTRSCPANKVKGLWA